tara:strand:- start:8908 stop:10557 length:1650 start_codon:yes stop_codon:yes gene_type:complete
LTKLKIKNFVLIDDLEVDFNDGMTCITGETGAGKSILLGGLSLVLGKRADLSSLHDVSRKCIVEAIFQISFYNLKHVFDENDIDYQEETILRREILPKGKSRAFINDTPVNLNVLEEVSLKLIDIHSQNDTSSLLKNEYQFQVLDALANNQMILEEYKQNLLSFKEINKEFLSTKALKEKSIDDYEYKKYLYEELDATHLELGIEERLEDELSILNSVELIQNSMNKTIQSLEAESYGIIDQLKDLQRNNQEISNKSNQFEELFNRVKGSTIELEDISEEYKKIFNSLEVNPQKTEDLKRQIDNLNKLFFKHKVGSVEELLLIKEEINSFLENSINLDDKLNSIEQEIRKRKISLKEQCLKLSENRKKVISVLEKELKRLVSKMGMDQANFKIELSTSEDFLFNGSDILSFEFSANKGHDFKILKKVASGGELSRIMLAIKTLLSRFKKLPTIIFDEIDTGVSGKISDNIAEIMANLGSSMQVFTITHLPQVAAKGDHHFKVEKKTEGDKSLTKLSYLNTKQRIDEIAMMLSGNKITDTAIAHAKQLMN